MIDDLIDDVPSNLKSAAILQLVSGLITVSVMCCISWMTIGTIGFLCTLVVGGFGGVCGMLGWVLVPIGIFEIVSGTLGLTNPKVGGKVMKICSFVEVGAILFGGLSTALAGGVALVLLRDADVQQFLQD